MKLTKSISLLAAAFVFAAQPIAASAVPAIPSSAGGAPDPVVQVRGEHHGGGRRHGGGKHRSGKRHGGGKHHGGGKRHDGGGKRHKGGDKHRGDRHRDRHDHGGKRYHGHHRHEHHRWHWRGGIWVRPADYWWIAGGAIAAGAAIGYLTAADAAAWAYDPPASTGYCWFYTDATRENGFWDQCPGPGAAVAPAPASAGQPNMQQAIDDLNGALAALQAATPNKGGHRERAIKIIRRAIDQLQQGIDWANQH